MYHLMHAPLVNFYIIESLSLVLRPFKMPSALYREYYIGSTAPTHDFGRYYVRAVQ